MDKAKLLDVLSSEFDQKSWQDVLVNVFSVKNIYQIPISIPLPANDKADSAFETAKFLTADDREIGVYQVNIKSGVRLEKNKVGLRQLLRNIYKYEVDGALIVFVQNEKWRLSFVSEIRKFDENGEVIRLETEPKRYTYLLGVGEKTRTARDRLLTLSGKLINLEDIREAFSVEKLNEEFYQTIAQYFYKLVGATAGKGKAQMVHERIMKLPSVSDDNNRIYHEFAVRLIGRIIFCWFLKMKKSETGNPLLPENLLSSDAVKRNYGYYKNILERLFFQTLNTPMKERLNNLPPGCENIPFLNGGLFEPHNDDFFKPDNYSGISSAYSLEIPEAWFTELYTELEKYNFTIDENSINDMEVSVDPEMLGRIFENLLAEIDPDSGETARKATGSFYTPREIVDYMATESLVHYLYKETGIEKEKLYPVFKYDKTISDDNLKNEKERILDAIDRIKILDPACGSGAFPMGVMHKLITALDFLDPKSKIWLKKQLDKIPDAHIRKITKEKLESENVEYIHKLGVIQNSIYGIDIQPIAVEIAKLRCFLSLIVDENIDDTKENRGVMPLPNLEFKFVCANSLKNVPEETTCSDKLFDADPYFSILKDKVKLYFNSYKKDEKNNLKKEILKLIDSKVEEKENEIRDSIKNRDITKVKEKKLAVRNEEIAEEIALWESYKNIFKNEPIGFFNIKYFYPDVEEGFDIVIGNPPYVQLQKDSGRLANMYKNCGYKTFQRTGDIYALFYESGINSLIEKGNLCFITSNKWMRAGYGKSLRNLFLSKNPIMLIDLGPGIFKQATVDTNILLIEKHSNEKKLKAVTLNKSNNGAIDISAYFKEKAVELKNLTEDSWFIGNDAEQKLKEKIEKIGKPLKDWDVNIYYGIKTGLNEAFIIDTATKEKLCKEDQKSAEIIKPILRGRDIKRYSYEWAGLWLLATGYDINVPKKYPAVYKHLLKYEEQAKKRDDQGTNWWNLRACAYYNEFEKEKIV
ncbi:MAG TPA: N-6 DNA methylase [Clostridiales bacterium]|nr:N-6 DNA methylase [Clostridiales bacterium]